MHSQRRKVHGDIARNYNHCNSRSRDRCSNARGSGKDHKFLIVSLLCFEYETTPLNSWNHFIPLKVERQQKYYLTENIKEVDISRLGESKLIAIIYLESILRLRINWFEQEHRQCICFICYLPFF